MPTLTQSHHHLLKRIYGNHGVWEAKVQLGRTHAGEVERITWEAETLTMLSQLEDAGILAPMLSGVARSTRMGSQAIEEFIPDRYITQDGMSAVLAGQRW